MKIYKFGLLAFLTLFLFSCEKETEGLSRSTYYVAFEILGDNPAIVQAGEVYVDAGVVATMNGVNVTSSITTTSNVDYDEMGMYRVEYTATNADGLKSRAIRDVIVCNPSVTTDISGVWTVSTDGTYRLLNGAETPYGGANFRVRINRLAPGFFSVSDFLAGWYEVRSGYGSSYAISGYVALNGDNTIDFLSSSISPWGVGLDYFRNGIYDPETESIKWVVGFGAPLGSNMNFYVTLTK